MVGAPPEGRETCKKHSLLFIVAVAQREVEFMRLLICFGSRNSSACTFTIFASHRAMENALSHNFPD
jgi:hypothetical protein